MRTPAISVSMHDAANTRENEGPCICDSCDGAPDTCGESIDFCIESVASMAGEAQMEARRDER